jgi:hypothetical protein
MKKELKYNHNLINTLIDEGKSAKEIKQLTNTPPAIIHYLFKKRGLKPLIKKDLDEPLILELFKEGIKTTEIEKILSISIGKIHYYLNKNKITPPKRGENLRSIKFNLNIFEKIDTEEKAYWLGFLYADGFNSQKNRQVVLSLSAKDENHLIKFKNFMGGNSTIKYSFIKNLSGIMSKTARLVISSVKISNDLANLGCTQKKTFTLKFPTEEQVPSHLVHHFIRGYFDGDGSVFLSNEVHHRSKKVESIIHCRIMSTKEFLVEFLKISKIGNMFCIKSVGNVYDYQIKRNTRCKELYEYLYNDATVFLERKKQIFDKYYNRRSETIISFPEKEKGIVQQSLKGD